jgi:hypothetical protein
MSDDAGFLCAVAGLPAAAAAATALRRAVFAQGFTQVRPAQVCEIFRWRHLALASEAVLAAISHYAAAGGGSRGARAYLASDGTAVPLGRSGPLEDYRFRVERSQDRGHKLVVRWNGEGVVVAAQPLRELEPPAGIYFERNWAAFLTGEVYRPGFRHH